MHSAAASPPESPPADRRVPEPDVRKPLLPDLNGRRCVQAVFVWIAVGQQVVEEAGAALARVDAKPRLILALGEGGVAAGVWRSLVVQVEQERAEARFGAVAVDYPPVVMRVVLLTGLVVDLAWFETMHGLATHIA